jgi:hypothetical protein
VGNVSAFLENNLSQSAFDIRCNARYEPKTAYAGADNSPRVGLEKTTEGIDVLACVQDDGKMWEACIVCKCLHTARNNDKRSICLPTPIYIICCKGKDASGDLNREFLEPEILPSSEVALGPLLSQHRSI